MQSPGERAGREGELDVAEHTHARGVGEERPAARDATLDVQAADRAVEPRLGARVERRAEHVQQTRPPVVQLARAQTAWIDREVAEAICRSEPLLRRSCG